MSTPVALAEIICRTAVILAGIWAGRGFLMALVPQLRIQAPAKTGASTPAGGKEPAAGDAKTPASVNGGQGRGEGT